MPAAYSEDLQWKIVFHHFLYGHNPESIARQLIISRLTVLRILNMYWDTGNVHKSHIPGRPCLLSCKCLVAPWRFPLMGYFIKLRVPRFSTRLFFWKWGVKKIYNQWKRGSIGSKIKRKFIQNALNLLNNTLWWTIRPSLGPSISRTKYDRDKQILSAERDGQSDCVEG